MTSLFSFFQKPSTMSLERFLHMGGYAFYVWTSYGLALGVLLLNVVLPLRRHARTLRTIERQLKQEMKHR